MMAKTGGSGVADIAKGALDVTTPVGLRVHVLIMGKVSMLYSDEWHPRVLEAHHSVVIEVATRLIAGCAVVAILDLMRVAISLEGKAGAAGSTRIAPVIRGIHMILDAPTGVEELLACIALIAGWRVAFGIEMLPTSMEAVEPAVASATHAGHGDELKGSGQSREASQAQASCAREVVRT
jgi:hypothetical protein